MERLLSDIDQIKEALKRHHRWSRSWKVTGREVLGTSKGLAQWIAKGGTPNPAAVRHYMEKFKPILDGLPDPGDIEAIAAAALREIGVGAESAITARDLARRLLVAIYRVRQAMRLLREAGILIVSGPGGCYLPATEQEVEAAIRLLEKRRDGLNRTISLLRAAKARTSERAIKIAQPVEVTAIRGTAG